MTNSEDVLEAATALWDGAALSDVAAGGLIHGRVKQDAVSPYASVDVEEGPLLRTSTARYLQTFTLTFRAWDEVGTADLGTVMAAVDDAYEILEQTVIGLPNGRDLDLKHSRRLPGKVEEDPATKAGQSVKTAQAKYEWLVESGR